jgi:hypothetical protein
LGDKAEKINQKIELKFNHVLAQVEFPDWAEESTGQCNTLSKKQRVRAVWQFWLSL